MALTSLCILPCTNHEKGDFGSVGRSLETRWNQAMFLFCLVVILVRAKLLKSFSHSLERQRDAEQVESKQKEKKEKTAETKADKDRKVQELTDSQINNRVSNTKQC